MKKVNLGNCFHLNFSRFREKHCRTNSHYPTTIDVLTIVRGYDNQLIHLVREIHRGAEK